MWNPPNAVSKSNSITPKLPPVEEIFAATLSTVNTPAETEPVMEPRILAKLSKTYEKLKVPALADPDVITAAATAHARKNLDIFHPQKMMIANEY